MKEKISSFDNKVIKEIDLDKSIFGLEFREDIIYRMIRYQLSKRRSGNHKTKGIIELFAFIVSYNGKALKMKIEKTFIHKFHQGLILTATCSFSIFMVAAILSYTVGLGY